jgi:predicted transcriptional regulator of viral defense system/very-short-patch-repair endonuclease
MGPAVSSGPAGPVGPAGTARAAGPAGAAGRAGAAGAAGGAGATGAAGRAGGAGATGAAGRAGGARRAREDRISDMVARQHGVVTRGQLMDAGVSSAAIGRRLKAGRLRALHSGVYLAGPIEPERALEMAAVLAGGPAAALSHASALHVWKLLRFEAPRPVHVSGPGDRHVRRPGIVFHRVSSPWTDEERTVVDGIPITTPARTMVDVARMLGRREIELALATAEREGLISGVELARLADRYPRRPGMALLRSLIQEQTGPHSTESEAERKCLELLRNGGLPRPHTNVTVGPYRLDVFWPDLNVAVEIDGRAFHSAGPRFEGDRQKDNWLRARGIEVIRLTWRKITRKPVATAVLVGQALALAEARRQTTALAAQRSRDPDRPRP